MLVLQFKIFCILTHIGKRMKSFSLNYIMRSFDFSINSCTLLAGWQVRFSFRRASNLSHSYTMWHPWENRAHTAMFHLWLLNIGLKTPFVSRKYRIGIDSRVNLCKTLPWLNQWTQMKMQIITFIAPSSPRTSVHSIYTNMTVSIILSVESASKKEPRYFQYTSYSGRRQ